MIMHGKLSVGISLFGMVVVTRSDRTILHKNNDVRTVAEIVQENGSRVVKPIETKRG